MPAVPEHGPRAAAAGLAAHPTAGTKSVADRVGRSAAVGSGGGCPTRPGARAAENLAAGRAAPPKVVHLGHRSAGRGDGDSRAELGPVFSARARAGGGRNQNPAPAVAKAITAQPPRSPEPQAPGGQRRETVERPASSPGLPSPGVAKHENAEPSPSAQPAGPPEVKPAEADPFSSVAEKPAERRRTAHVRRRSRRHRRCKSTLPLGWPIRLMSSN